MLDTAVTLSELRDNIKNMRYSVEEADLTVQESKYEPPTTIRQAEISLDKAKRTLDQAIKTYGLKVEQAKTDMRTLKKTLSDQRQRVNDFQTILEKFVIKAPSDGMVIYKRDRTNAKRKVGSSISPWDNVVATLPDMSSMLSTTYVNEIDVSKVKPGQKVEIIVDAFPEKSYTGSVLSVANIGEQLPNADAKVFEVQIKLDGTDPILRPSMTTGNKILTKTISNVIFVPLECVQTGTDSIPYVYTKNGDKQVVVLGESNENNVIIEQGVKPDENLFLSTPAKANKFKLTGENLIAINRERAREKQAAEIKAREAAAKAKENRQQTMGGDPNPAGNGNMRGNFQQGQFNGPRDTARMRKFMQMMRNNPQGIRMDSSGRRRNMPRGGQQGFPQGPGGGTGEPKPVN
jgi:HlyD family secretion protein